MDRIVKAISAFEPLSVFIHGCLLMHVVGVGFFGGLSVLLVHTAYWECIAYEGVTQYNIQTMFDVMGVMALCGCVAVVHSVCAVCTKCAHAHEKSRKDAR